MSITNDDVRASQINARLDRLPASPTLWKIVVLLAVGGFFETYDLFFTGYVAPAMVRAGLFAPPSMGILSSLKFLSISGAGTFVFSTFAGLWIGTLIFSQTSDRLGRKIVFTWSLVWYSICSIFMAFSNSGEAVDAFRFLAGIGIGAQLATLYAFLAEMVPPAVRGRAFAVYQAVVYSSIPIVALLAWLLIPLRPFGLEGWRVIVILSAAGAIIVWFVQRVLPESPRWLAAHGQITAAEKILDKIEADIEKSGHRLKPVTIGNQDINYTANRRRNFGLLFTPRFRKITFMLSVFNIAQVIGFYGFAAWIPTLLESQGVKTVHSLEYGFVIAIANPVGCLLGILCADILERKWQIVTCAAVMMVTMILFSQSAAPVALIIFGALFTMAAAIMTLAFQNYQAELYPTEIRARAVGFVYSWSRISAAFSGLLIGYFLKAGGTGAVAIFIGGAMAVVMLSIGILGPTTNKKSLELLTSYE